MPGGGVSPHCELAVEQSPHVGLTRITTGHSYRPYASKMNDLVEAEVFETEICVELSFV